MARTSIFPSPTTVRSLQDARFTSRNISWATSSSGWTIRSIFKSSGDKILPSIKSIERVRTIFRAMPNLSAIKADNILVESSFVAAIIRPISCALASRQLESCMAFPHIKRASSDSAAASSNSESDSITVTG